MHRCSPILAAALLSLGCAHTEGPVPGETTVVVEPPPARTPLEGCPRINPTCTYQALAVEFGRADALPDYCLTRLQGDGPDAIVGRVRVEGLARLEGAARWDILEDLELLAKKTFRTCYQEGLREDPTLAGAMELEFEVEAARSCVDDIHISGSSVDDLRTRECVIEGLRGYPLPSAGSLLAVRLVFEPQE